MVGRATFGVTRAAGDTNAGPSRGPVLTMDNVAAAGAKGGAALRGLSLQVLGGEVVAVAGVAGNGQSELAQVLQGLRAVTGGRLDLNGRSLVGLTPGEILARGVGHIPEDRLAAVVGDMSVAENIVLPYLGDFTHGGRLDQAAILAHARQLIAEYQIKAGPFDRIRTLSGGNMQKVILARSLHRNPALVVAVDPTRGLDIGATDYVRSRLLEQRARGAGVLLISEDLDEILALADRILVMYEGRLVGEVPAAEATPERLGLLMAGAVQPAAS
jgi:simple sugar transport system ATP-binding protein